MHRYLSSGSANLIRSAPLKQTLEVILLFISYCEGRKVLSGEIQWDLKTKKQTTLMGQEDDSMCTCCANIRI